VADLERSTVASEQQDERKYKSIPDIFCQLAETHAEEICLVDPHHNEAKDLSYRCALIRAVALWLRGVQHLRTRARLELYQSSEQRSC
jgi:hypothetical protein